VAFIAYGAWWLIAGGGIAYLFSSLAGYVGDGISGAFSSGASSVADGFKSTFSR
jgi:hypothetical protein